MTGRCKFRTAGLLAAAGLLLVTGAVRGAEVNVLLVTIDTLRTDRLSCYTPKYLRTPRIDALAGAGTLFERAFAHNPITLASHTNILLGLTPPAHGVSENSKSVVPSEFLSLAELLKAQGFATGAFVSSFSLDSRFGLDQGFDTYDDAYPAKTSSGLLDSERPAEKTLTAALAWLDAQKDPWFCWVHLWDPHAPYEPPAPFAEQFKTDPYSGEVAYVDAQLGRLFDWLDRHGGLGSTVVILTADHGESLGEHGELYHSYFAYNSTIWVPLIVAGPGVARAARVKDYVSHVDLYPTVCDLLGLRKPGGLQGASLGPLLKGRTRKAAPIYFESLDPCLNRGWAPLRGFIRDGQKYIESPLPELYDLAKDFDEKTNLSPPADLASTKKEFDAFFRSLGQMASGQGTGGSDRETRERLRSLGYVVSPVSQAKTSYGPQDDLKTLLPFEQKTELVQALRSAGRDAEAVKVLEDVIAARPDFAQAYFKLGDIYETKGLVEDRLQALERGARANPKNFVMIAGYGITLVNKGRYQKGIDVLTEAMSLFDQDTEVWSSLGIAYWRTGAFDKALPHFEHALALDPDGAVANDNMGSFFVATALRTRNAQDVAKALPLFDKALAADPSLASAYNGRAGALKILGRIDDAIADWQRALSLDPRFDFPAYNLAVCFLEKGDKTTALEYCRRYLEIKGRAITPEEKRDVQALIEKCRAQGGDGGPAQNHS
jgi:arylsulfatase A-like enzyme/Flp pilus assembly protein TadD